MASGQQGFGLPEGVLALLPADPFEQLDIARKITSIALSSRVSGLEEEIAALRRELEEKEDMVEELQAQVESLEATVEDMSAQLARAEEEKEALRRENVSLSSTVNKLNRDVSKLEVFKKTLMQSLREDDEAPTAGNQNISSKKKESGAISEPGSTITDETGGVDSEDANAGFSIRQGLSLGSVSVTPRLTPPDSPTRLSKPGSPKRHSIAFAGPRPTLDERPSGFSSMSSSPYGSMSGPADSPSQGSTGRAKVDGKEFLRQVRTRLSYEQFNSFLANVKELNSHKQTREEALRKAEEIFGAENRDLYAIFEGLIGRTGMKS